MSETEQGRGETQLLHESPKQNKYLFSSLTVKMIVKIMGLLLAATFDV